jgi:hypothetical protein
LTDFHAFVLALENTVATITKENFNGLSQLCKEFGFEDLDAELSQFHDSDDSGEQAITEGSQTQKRLSELEEEMRKQRQENAALKCQVSRQGQTQESAQQGVRGEIDKLRVDLSALKAAPVPATTAITPPSPASAGSRWGFRCASNQITLPLAPGFNSKIISDFPDIFSKFRTKRFTLLWRGSRDTFQAKNFHWRCNRHANTMMVILDTKGNIFGGFTPVQWESKLVKDKGDPSGESFLFTLTNPHQLPPRTFALTREKEHVAIQCMSDWGPNFHEIGISNLSNENDESFAYFDGSEDSYINDSNVDGRTLFTGSEQFRVKEIEVYEISI